MSEDFHVQVSRRKGGTRMLDQELACLSEHSNGGVSRGDGGKGWSLMAPVLDARGRRVVGYLRIESNGGADDSDLVTELEDAPLAW
jgi:hypothetical protein